MQVKEINKEKINEVVFKNHAQSSSEVNNEVYSNLKRAVFLGNTIKQKVKLFFETNEGLKMVNTTIWFESDKHVVLKGGVVVTTSSIVKVEI